MSMSTKKDYSFDFLLISERSETNNANVQPILDKDFICKLSTGQGKVIFGLMANEVEEFFDWVFADNRCEKRLVVTGDCKATVIDRDKIESIEIERKGERE